MTQNPIYLTDEQRQFVEETLPALCGRAVGKKIRRWLKQWLMESLNKK